MPNDSRVKPRVGIDVVDLLAVEDVLVLAAVVALPWFYGGVGLGAYRAAAAFVAVAAGFALARRGPSGLGLGRETLWLLPAFLLGAFAFAQVVPLPRAWIATLSPRAASIQSEAYGSEGATGETWLRRIEEGARARVPEGVPAAADPAKALAFRAGAPAPPRRFTLSLQPDMTLERAFWYAALLLTFLLVYRRTAHEPRAAIYRATLFGSFVTLAIVGILNHMTAPDRLLWIRTAPESTRPFGPYVNPDHFAGVMELGVPWLLGYGLMTLARRGAPARLRAGHVLALTGGGVGIAAAFLAASKTAALTIGVSSAVLIAIAAWRGRGRMRWGLVAGSAACVLLLGAIAFSGPLRGRLEDFRAAHEGGLSTNDRNIVWTVGLGMAKDYALTGSGFGAFREVIPAYLPRGDSGLWLQLHNDYLEMVLAGGLVAVTLVAWLAAVFASRVVRAVRAESADGRLLPSLGLAMGLVALALHEIVDFNLQIPANALLFVVLAAMSVSPVARSLEGS
jgi:hypothetical protein